MRQRCASSTCTGGGGCATGWATARTRAGETWGRLLLPPRRVVPPERSTTMVRDERALAASAWRGQTSGARVAETDLALLCTTYWYTVVQDPPTRPRPSSVERRSRGKWLQTAPQEPRSMHMYCRSPATSRVHVASRHYLVSVGRRIEIGLAPRPRRAYVIRSEVLS